MQLRTSLLSLVALSLVMASSASASVAGSGGPRDDSAHKFSKREPTPGHHTHTHYHAPSSGGGGGLMGSSGGSMLRNVAGGTLLAGGAAFAATGGSIAAHNLFDGHHDDDHREGGERGESGSGSGSVGRGAEYPLQMAPQQQVVGTVYPQQQKAQSGAARPVGIMMSDGSVLPVSAAAQVAPQYAQNAPAASSGGFAFPNQK